MALTKREKAWKDKLPPGKQYSIDEALKLVKTFATAKFTVFFTRSVAAARPERWNSPMPR